MMDPNPNGITTPSEADLTGGTSEVGPSLELPQNQQPSQNPLVTLPMTEAEVKEWRKRIDESDTRVKAESESWKSLLKSYLPNVRPPDVEEEVNSNSHFRNVHTKLGQMFLQAPEVRLEAAPNSPAEDTKPGPMPGSVITRSDIIAVKQEYLNKKLGRDGIKVNRLFDALNLDVLAWAGIGCSKLGYTIITKEVQQPVMQPDPTFQPPQQPGNVLGLSPTPQAPMVPQMGPDGKPLMQTVKVPIFEEPYWRRFSPMKYVGDASLYSTQHDEDATFLGMRFSMFPAQAMQAFNLTEMELKPGKDEHRYEHAKETDPPQVITGVEIFLKAAYFIQGEMHPQKLIQLVLLDNISDRPIVYRPCVDQTFTETGELTDDSIDKFPIRVLTIRDLPDSPFPPADSAFTNNLVKQLNTSRRQGVQLRNRAVGKIVYDMDAFDEKDVSKINAAKPGDWIGVEGGRMEKGVNSIVADIAQPTRTNDDYRLDAMLQHNQDETLGISANSSGASEDTVRSATEIQAIQRAVMGRNQKERGRSIDHFLDGVRLVDILISRYTTTIQWAKITGIEGSQRMQAWTGDMVAGRWIYDIAPDSQMDVDTAQDRQQNLSLYNLTAGDPLVNRIPILQRLFRQFGYDPMKVIANQMQQMTQPPHGGAGGAVNKHEMGKSGGDPNQPGASDHRAAQP